MCNVTKGQITVPKDVPPHESLVVDDDDNLYLPGGPDTKSIWMSGQSSNKHIRQIIHNTAQMRNKKPSCYSKIDSIM